MNSIFIRMNINRIFFNISDHIDFSVVLQIVFHGQCTVGMLDRSWRPRNYYSGISSPRSPEAQSRSLMVLSLKNISFFPLFKTQLCNFRIELKSRGPIFQGKWRMEFWQEKGRKITRPFRGFVSFYQTHQFRENFHKTAFSDSTFVPPFTELAIRKEKSIQAKNKKICH